MCCSCAQADRRVACSSPRSQLTLISGLKRRLVSPLTWHFLVSLSVEQLGTLYYSGMFFPWLRSRHDSTSYSTLKQEEGVRSEDEFNHDAPIAGRQAYSQKKFIISLIINGTLLAILVAMYMDRWTHSKSKRLLPSPVPDCEYPTSSPSMIS